MSGNKLQWNQYDVGVDNNNYTPISWAEVKTKMKLDENEARTRKEAEKKLELVVGHL